MLYEEARVYLDGVSKYGSVLGLDSIKNLLDELENPQNNLTFIHIAGTNGKGSILAYLSTILTAAGYRTGRYISPTVMDYLERFQIDGAYMEKDEFADLVEQVKSAAERMVEYGKPCPTVFEMETAIAFLYFERKNCDYVVLESGLGGSLDATNVIEKSRLCVFASVSMDHIGVLGNTLEEIAEDKAGIIKRGSSVVTGIQKQSVKEILKARAEQMEAGFIQADPKMATIQRRELMSQTFSYKEFPDLEIRLPGQHQVENVVTALEAVMELQRQGVRIPEEAVREGLRKTRWPGRFTVLSRHPLVIADGAHNEDAARRLCENIELYLNGRKIIAVTGVFKDKEYEKIAALVAPYLEYAYTIDLPNEDRTLEKEKLCEIFLRNYVNAESCESLKDAISLAKQRAKEDGVVLIFGSLSFLGEVIRLEESAEEN